MRTAVATRYAPMQEAKAAKITILTISDFLAALFPIMFKPTILKPRPHLLCKRFPVSLILTQQHTAVEKIQFDSSHKARKRN